MAGLVPAVTILIVTVRPSPSAWWTACAPQPLILRSRAWRGVSKEWTAICLARRERTTQHEAWIAHWNGSRWQRLLSRPLRPHFHQGRAGARRGAGGGGASGA